MNLIYKRATIEDIDILVKEIKNKGISSISLEATDMGRPLYEKYGFVKMNSETELLEWEIRNVWRQRNV